MVWCGNAYVTLLACHFTIYNMSFLNVFDAFHEPGAQEIEEIDSDEESITEYVSEDEIDTIKSIMSLVANAPSSSSPHRKQTRNFSIMQRNSDTLARDVLDIIRLMASKQMNLPIFLDALFWGCEELIDNHTARWQRTALLKSWQFLALLRRWAKPPAGHDKSHNRGSGASAYMHAWAMHHVRMKMEKELTALVKHYHVPKDFLTKEQMMSISFSGVLETFKEKAPTTCALLRNALVSRQQERRNVKKDLDSVSLPDFHQTS